MHYREAVRCNPGCPDVKSLAILLQRDELAGYFEKIQQNPDDITAHKKLCELAICSTVRQTHLRELTRCDPNNASWHYALAKNLVDAKNDDDYDEAEAHCREAIRCDSNHVNAHNTLGLILHRWKKDLPAAAEAYREALRCNPDNASAHFGIGRLLFNRARGQGLVDTSLKEAGLRSVSSGLFYAAAAGKFRDAIRCDPNHYEANVFLGVVLDHYYEDYAGAEEVYRTCIRLNPTCHVNRPLSILLVMKLDCRGAIKAYYNHALGNPKDALQDVGIVLVLVMAAGAEMWGLWRLTSS
jgi:tetratricopeptide (TPR) repeat protein